MNRTQVYLDSLKAAKKAKHTDLLTAMLEELLGEDDRSFDEVRTAYGEHCRHCGRGFEEGQTFCNSDDCIGFQARELLKEVQA